MDAQHYFINHPIFLKYKKRFDWKRFRRTSYLKSVHVNERIIEIPFVLQALASLSKAATVLDLGCTESPLPLQLAMLGFRVTGYDYREYPYSHPNLNFVQGDITQLPFADNTFDAVVAISTIEHIGVGFYADPKQGQEADLQAMAQALRVLKPKGVMLLTVPYGIAQDNRHQRVYDQDRLKRLLTGINMEACRFFQTASGTPCANTWVEVSAEVASRVASPDRTQAVCLVRGHKA